LVLMAVERSRELGKIALGPRCNIRRVRAIARDLFPLISPSVPSLLQQ